MIIWSLIFIVIFHITRQDYGVIFWSDRNPSLRFLLFNHFLRALVIYCRVLYAITFTLRKLPLITLTAALIHSCFAQIFPFQYFLRALVIYFKVLFFITFTLRKLPLITLTAALIHSCFAQIFPVQCWDHHFSISITIICFFLILVASINEKCKLFSMLTLYLE